MTLADLAEYVAHGPEMEVQDERPAKENRSGSAEGCTEGIPRKPGGDRARAPSPHAEGTTGGDSQPSGDNAPPYRILGIADDGDAYFLDQWGRLQSWALKSLNQDCLRLLAPFGWWYLRFNHEGAMGKTQWAHAIEELTQKAGPMDFALDSQRGRGAWRNDDPETGAPTYLYWDGSTLTGAAASEDSEHVYLRMRRRDIGLSAPPATAEARRAMLDIASTLSFETKADVVRILGWSVLAPYGGALSWRPSGFMTGNSGTGKSTIFKYIVKPLAGMETKQDTCTGSESSGAGVRQWNPADSTPFGVDESDSDNESKRHNVGEIISIMRVSTSDDTPPALKGTQNQAGLSFQLRRMFIFMAIDDSVGEAADQKRFFYVNVRKPQDSPQDWMDKKPRLLTTFSRSACQAVRAFTWIHLSEIIEAAEAMTDAVARAGNLETRYATAEAMLFAAFWRVFMDRYPEPEELSAWLGKIYDAAPPERVEDEGERMLERILADVVHMDGDYKKQETLGRILTILSTRTEDGDTQLDKGQLLPYRRTALFAGLYINTTGELCVFLKNPYLTKMLENKDYHKALRRHTLCREKDHVTNPGGGYKAGHAVIFDPAVLATDDLPF